MLFSAVSSFSFELLYVDRARAGGQADEFSGAAVALGSGHGGHVGIQIPGVEVKRPRFGGRLVGQ